jgi:NAD(P)-dependent dehydrogenase (short-subunit alcohol dehydrogenase family)
VLVTGGASGIGAAICAALAAAGWEPVPADIAGGEGVVRLDVRDETGWEEAVAKAGPLAGLVNCAGIRTSAALVDLEVDEFDRIFAVNVRGTFLGLRTAARRWIGEGSGGAVVNITSVNAFVALPGQCHYVASKGALTMLTKAAALELAAHGIRVNAVAPGGVRTPMTAERLADPAQLARINARIPLGRVAEPAEIAGAVVFLLDPRASYVTGTTLVVDGGWTCR